MDKCIQFCSLCPSEPMRFPTLCVFVCSGLAKTHWRLCVGQVRTVGYLRCDAGAPSHALLSAPRRGGPPNGLRAVSHHHAAFWHGPWGTRRGVAPRWKSTSGHGLTPSLSLRSSLTGVIVVAGPRPAAAAPLCPLRTIRVLMGDPAGRGPGEAVAEAFRRDVSQHHVAEAQAHALRVEGLDLSGLPLQ